MPAFPVKSAQQLADFLIPVTPEIATQIIEHAGKANDGMCFAAVYYFGGTSAKPKRRSIALEVSLDLSDNDLFAYVVTGDYHPRTRKADITFKSDAFIHD